MKTINFATVIAAFFPSLLVHAIPVKVPDCAKDHSFKDVNGGSGAVWNEDCTKLYVLPPKLGTLTVDHYTAYSTLQSQCKRLDDIDADGTDLQAALRADGALLKQFSEERLKINNELHDGLLPVGETKESLTKRLQDLLDFSKKLRDGIKSEQTDNDDRRLVFSRTAGSQGTFRVETANAEILSKYIQANPNLSVQLMPVDQMFLSINEQTPTTIDQASMPAVRSLTLPALGEMPLLLDPRILAEHKELTAAKAPPGGKYFNGALEGSIIFSNIGACAVQKALGGVISNFSAEDVKSFIAANATYAYQVQVTRKHSLTYNFKKLIQVIHEQVKRGGLFNSSTLDSLIDTRRESEWVTFNVESQDGRFEYTDDYIRDIKKQLIDRALGQIVSLQADNPAPLLGLIEPGKDGAAAIGSELGKCLNVYCQIGAAGFRVLDSIFGSSEAVSNLAKSVDGENSEVVNEKKMVPVYGTFTFQ